MDTSSRLRFDAAALASSDKAWKEPFHRSSIAQQLETVARSKECESDRRRSLVCDKSGQVGRTVSAGVREDYCSARPEDGQHQGRVGKLADSG
jgi:hypothetical protein